MRWFPASLIPLFLLSSLAAHAKILWKGDFETADLSQWSRLERVAPDRIQTVTSPVREGAWAVRVAVRQGDDPIRASGNRNELVYFDAPADGDEVFYRWSTFFPSTYPRTGGWQVFSQFHHTGCCGSPPVELYVLDERIQLRVGGTAGKVVWSAPLERAVWQDFVLQVRWSPNAKTGRIALWHQGQPVLPVTAMATRYPGEGTYLKLGLYRDAAIKPEAVIFHDAVVIATALEDVLPAPEPPVEPDDASPDDGAQDPPQDEGQAPGAGQDPPPSPPKETPGPGGPLLAPGGPGGPQSRSCSAGPEGLATLGLTALAGTLVRRRRARLSRRTSSGG